MHTNVIPTNPHTQSNYANTNATKKWSGPILQPRMHIAHGGHVALRRVTIKRYTL